MAELFADEDFPFPVVERLRVLRHDVLTTLESGLAGTGTDDEDILSEAVKLARAVLTMNRRDFIALHAANPNHAGIVVCKRDPNSTGLADRIHAAVTVAGDLTGQLIRVNRPNE
jgi:hypothetical protein